jgi:hypothetical protein
MNIENELVKTGIINRFFADIDRDDLQDCIDGANLIGAIELAEFLTNLLQLPEPESELDDFWIGWRLLCPSVKI